MPEQLFFVVKSEYDGMQAKRYLKQVCGVSARMMTKLKKTENGITMDGSLLRTVDSVKSGGKIIINMPKENFEFIEKVKGKIDVVYEDEFILAVNKPPFMPVHPVKQHQTDTLANLVAYYAEQRGEAYTFRAHNRLDRDTSGIVIIAKDKFTINRLKNNVKKTYYAVVHGKVSTCGSVIKPIGLKEDSKIVRHVIDEGSPAITHYEPLDYNECASLLSLSLETGKTHQIRCHMSYLGHPLIGDELYGGKRDYINRQALHCGSVEFIHPVKNNKLFLNAPLPEDIKTALSKYNLFYKVKED